MYALRLVLAIAENSTSQWYKKLGIMTRLLVLQARPYYVQGPYQLEMISPHGPW